MSDEADNEDIAHERGRQLIERMSPDERTVLEARALAYGAF
jgi:hypothetical protein